jgi:hypothetical protein
LSFTGCTSVTFFTVCQTSTAAAAANTTTAVATRPITPNHAVVVDGTWRTDADKLGGNDDELDEAGVTMVMGFTSLKNAG